jgi:5-methylcytosine-specific restriction protein A
VGIRKHGIEPEDRAFLLRQHDTRGIVAAGTFTSEIYQDEHWDGSGRPTVYADVDFENILAPEDRLPVDVLRREVPDVPWDRLQGSGVQVPAESEGALEDLWDEHLGTVEWKSPEEERVGLYSEGDVARVEVNRYERDLRVRQACIDHWGCRCAVCDMSFEDTYGDIGQAFIHVHHLKPLASQGRPIDVDPVKDLRPVCPNCHAMLHRGNPPITIRSLSQRVRKRMA